MIIKRKQKNNFPYPQNRKKIYHSHQLNQKKIWKPKKVRLSSSMAFSTHLSTVNTANIIQIS